MRLRKSSDWVNDEVTTLNKPREAGPNKCTLLLRHAVYKRISPSKYDSGRIPACQDALVWDYSYGDTLQLLPVTWLTIKWFQSRLNLVYIVYGTPETVDSLPQTSIHHPELEFIVGRYLAHIWLNWFHLSSQFIRIEWTRTSGILRVRQLTRTATDSMNNQPNQFVCHRLRISRAKRAPILSFPWLD